MPEDPPAQRGVDARRSARENGVTTRFDVWASGQRFDPECTTAWPLGPETR